MPLFMDVHRSLPEGVTADDLMHAHEADVQTQAKYGVTYLNFWADPQGGKAFCLVEAPDAETAHAVHREAHGLVADEIYPVFQG
ncbi:MAG: DUF4242 domain-containing protein [Planctomycetaceae bacterium]